MKITLTYFKDTGKFYSEGEYETDTPYYNVGPEVRRMLRAGNNPGLIDGAVMRNGFHTHIWSDEGGYPILVPAGTF